LIDAREMAFTYCCKSDKIMDWKKQIHEDYRKKFGCKNVGKVCWCEVCVNVEKIIEEVIEKVKENIGK
jgi:hypothetical protein